MSGCCGHNRQIQRPAQDEKPRSRVAGQIRADKPKPKDGAVLVSAERAAERMAICRACEHFRVSPIAHCAACGCALALKTKLKIGKCPIGKW